jgi:hypothetical protein
LQNIYTGVIKSDKKLKDLSLLISKDNTLLVTEAIKLLRDEEPFEGAIGLLAGLFDRSDNELINITVEDFFNDIKDPAVRPEIIAEIKAKWKPKTISMLVASCWQSGLDYSPYYETITEKFMSANYSTAIECMTVIEASMENLSKKQKSQAIHIIMTSPFPETDEKYRLALELIKILEI